MRPKLYVSLCGVDEKGEWFNKKELIQFSRVENPDSWSNPDYKVIKFPFNIEKVIRWVLKTYDSLTNKPRA